LVAKDKDVSRERIVVQVLPHLFGQTVEAAAAIDRGRAQPDPHRRRKAQHGGTSCSTASTWRSVAASKPGGTRSLPPSARPPPTLPPAQDPGAASTCTRTKAACSASRWARLRRHA